MAMEHVQFIDDFLIQQHCIGDFPAMFHYRAVPGAPLGRVFLDATSRQPLEVMSTAPMGMAPMEKRPGVEAIVAGCLMDLISFMLAEAPLALEFPSARNFILNYPATPYPPGWLVHKQFPPWLNPFRGHRRHVATDSKFSSIRILSIIVFSCQAPCQDLPS